MKIAVCFSGLVRTYRDTYKNYVDYLLRPNSHHEIDTYISTWTTEHSNDSMEWTRRQAWFGDDAKPFPEEFIDHKDLHEKYDPTTLEVDQRINVDDGWAKATFNLRSFMLMTYKIHAADLLRRKREALTGERYDAVVRIRFDTLLPFPIEIEKLDLDVITVPNMMQPKLHPDHGWVNDKLAITKPELMTHYCDWYLHLQNIVQEGCPLQPETTLWAHLSKKDIKTNAWPCEMELVRIQGH